MRTHTDPVICPPRNEPPTWLSERIQVPFLYSRLASRTQIRAEGLSALFCHLFRSHEAKWPVLFSSRANPSKCPEAKPALSLDALNCLNLAVHLCCPERSSRRARQYPSAQPTQA